MNDSSSHKFSPRSDKGYQRTKHTNRSKNLSTASKNKNFGGKNFKSKNRVLEKKFKDRSFPKTPKMTSARDVSLAVLNAVEDDNAYANLLLPQLIVRASLDSRDSGLATELTYGTARWLRTYDSIIESCLSKGSIKDLETPVLNILRLGTHQLLQTRIEDHAAVDQSVRLAKKYSGHASGLVNAVLRKIAQKSWDQWREEDLGFTTNAQQQAYIYGHPEWIIRAFEQSLKTHGRNPEEISDMLDADNKSPNVHLVALDKVGSLDELVKAGATPSPRVENSAQYSGGNLESFVSIADGTVRVQDAGSTLVAQALAKIPADTASAEHTWADFCAAPGGKAAVLGAYAQEEDTTLFVNEITPSRADLVNDSLKALDPQTWEAHSEDAKKFGKKHWQEFDKILLDVPCSGLGSLRRRPEARWKKSVTEIASLTKTQGELLASAVDALKPGGVLAYSTCSPHIAETVLPVKDILKNRSDIELLNSQKHLNEIGLEPLFDIPQSSEAESKEGPLEQVTAKTAQLWPHIHDTDAMFLALLKKKK